MRPTCLTSLTFVFALAILSSPARAEKRAVKPTREWSGSVADHSLAADAPDYVANGEDLASLWNQWGIADELPTIDFSQELVVLATTRGSRLRLLTTLDDATGDLGVGGIATRDLRPGFRYVIATISREGVKTVNGKELPRAE